MPDVRSRYEAWREARETAHLRERSGRSSAGEAARELDELDARFDDVTSGGLLDGLRAERDAAGLDAQRDASTRLILGIEQAVIEHATRELDAEISSRETGPRIRVGRRRAGVAEWRETLADALEAEERLEIQRALDTAQAELRGLRQERFAQQAAALAALGQATWLERMRRRHSKLDVAAWTQAARRFLEATEPQYRDALSTALAGIGASPGSLQRAELRRIERRHAWDELFPASRRLACLDFTTSGLGVSAGSTPGIELDAGLRSGALCMAPRVPGRVWLLHATRAGADTYQALLEAAGRAFAFAYTSSELPIERRVLGDPALPRAWGILLGDLASDPDWIERGPAAPRARPFAQAARLIWLLGRRRAAALVAVEYELAGLGAGADPGPITDMYADVLSDALGCPHTPAACLSEASPELEALDALRAACLAAQLGEHLRQQYARRWWEQRAAGELLKELWNTGATYTAEGLADQLGLGALDVDFLIEVSLRA